MRTRKIAYATGAARHESPITNHDSPHECGLLGCAGDAKLPGGEPAKVVRVVRIGGMMATKQWSSTAPPGEFKPYVGPGESVAEFSLRAVILGSLFGVLFGAVSVYVGLRAGLTVSASIPIAVLSISILRAFGRSTILDQAACLGAASEPLSCDRTCSSS